MTLSFIYGNVEHFYFVDKLVYCRMFMCYLCVQVALQHILLSFMSIRISCLFCLGNLCLISISLQTTGTVFNSRYHHV